MSTQLIAVPVGNAQRIQVGDNQTIMGVPGATGTITLEASQDGINWTTVAQSGTGVVVSVNGRTLNLGQFAYIRATATTVAGFMAVCDLSQGTTKYGAGQAVIAQLSLPVVTPNATTAGALFHLRIPANYLKPNFMLQVDASFTATNNANVKTLIALFGNTGVPTAFHTTVLTSAAGGRLSLRIAGKNDGVTAVGSSIGSALGFGISTTAPVAISTLASYIAQEQELVITSTKATGTDNVTLDQAVVQLFQ